MEKSNQLVVFALDDQRYALHLSAVDRVVPMVRVTPLPKAPDIVIGVVNVQGRVIPVINMRRRFRLPEREAALTDRLIVAHTARRPVALTADAVAGVLEYPGQDIVAAEGVLPGVEHVEGIAKLKDGLILIHDLDRFLSLEEEQSLDRAGGALRPWTCRAPFPIHSSPAWAIFWLRASACISQRTLARSRAGVAAAASAFDMPDAEACAHWLLSAPLTHNQIEILASHLTVGETYFFREKRSFEVIEERVFPELLRARERTERRLRIWSAGCCTGEEPYSIAMLLDRLIPRPEEWNVTILATDINPEFLRKAAEGVYGEWSFRDTPAWLRERYFQRKRAGCFEIDERLRRRVTFSFLNLADDVYPSLTNNTNAMDVIFCRNVLMYFTAARARKVIENLYRSLVDGGWLIVSPTETSTSLFSGFTAVEFPGVVLYRKLAGAAPRMVVAGYPAPMFGAQPENLKPPEPAIFPWPVVADAAGSIPLMRRRRNRPAGGGSRRGTRLKARRSSRGACAHGARLRQPGQADRGGRMVRAGDRRRQAQPGEPISLRRDPAGTGAEQRRHTVA